jgi:hypothetical protein
VCGTHGGPCLTSFGRVSGSRVYATFVPSVIGANTQPKSSLRDFPLCPVDLPLSEYLDQQDPGVIDAGYERDDHPCGRPVEAGCRAENEQRAANHERQAGGQAYDRARLSFCRRQACCEFQRAQLNDERHEKRQQADRKNFPPNSAGGWFGTNPALVRTRAPTRVTSTSAGAPRQLGDGENTRQIDRYGDHYQSGQRRRRADLGNEEICPVGDRRIHPPHPVPRRID